MFRTLVLAILPCVLASPALAVEGMFLLDQLPAEKLKRSGLKIPPAELAKAARAVAQVASGGTGSFVSPRGLLVTNHHVAYRCLAMLGARKEHLGLLDRGHLAKSLAEELPCPGYDLLVVDGVRDVTADVLAAATPKQAWAARFEALRLKQAELVKACEAGAQRVCDIAALDGGAAYTLTTYRRIRDVRLVYAPPKALGKFGGDVDNWIFPRHTADFTFLRAYVDRAGAGAAYAKANVPLATPQHLKVSREGVRLGALVSVIGFPARTSRHVSSHSVRFYLEQHLPVTIGLLRGLIGVLEGETKRSEDVRRKYASLESGLQNAAKYYEMSKAGFERYRTVERKLEAERALAAKLAADPEASRKLKETLAEIKKVLDRYRTFFPKFVALSRLTGICPSVRTAYDIAKWSVEKQKPDTMRKEERYKEKNLYRIRDASDRLDQEINLDAEKALLLYFLRETEKLPAAQRPKSFASLLRWSAAERKRRGALAARLGVRLKSPALFHLNAFLITPKDPLEAVVHQLYGPAVVADAKGTLDLQGIQVTTLVARGAGEQELSRAKARRAELLDLKSAALRKVDDPLIRFARDLEAELTALKEGPHKEVEQYLGALLHARWVKEVLRPGYPDASFTVRLSYGSVRDYRASATGKTHRYLTSLSELIAKDRGAFPFLVPPALKAAFPERMKSPFVDRTLRDIPVNFTSTLDTTGGNSGSPVLDDRGRLVGLLFDGTPESILSDWQFLPDLQRSICLDIRFALYLATVDRNAALLRELGL